MFLRNCQFDECILICSSLGATQRSKCYFMSQTPLRLWHKLLNIFFSEKLDSHLNIYIRSLEFPGTDSKFLYRLKCIYNNLKHVYQQKNHIIYVLTQRLQTHLITLPVILESREIWTTEFPEYPLGHAEW